VIKRLTRHGNSLALVIDRPILDLLDIEADTPLEVKTDGSMLTVSPVRDPKARARFEKAWNAVRRRHAKAFKRLAE
jgi:antitoxin component of MazEF toxin-antitoxin module